ncbi:DNA-binding transcriptional activator (fragment) [uncultured Desulfobacterium sp.]|uniref:DNA-binding transcriptional activator n=1 Tax=uncultured Desulfobacterium sp. TaxID=201089 RepID=A0A445MTB4_9BACT
MAQQAVNQLFSEISEIEDHLVVDGGDKQSQRKFGDIIGNSNNMHDVFSLIESVADSDSTIIINGETGTGKGLIAREIHKHSNRKNKPFVQINCGAIPENLLESELFGHVRGAFTGATSPKLGKFEIANSGTIFLDEIGDMSHDLQVKLLRVLEEKEFEQVGGCKTIRVDVRVIAATHRDLEEEVQKGNFREDLFYRLYVIPIALPPLRDRKSDIPLLTAHFLKYFNEKNKRNVNGVSEEAMEIIMNHSWKGNVRELKNMVESLVVLKGDGTINPVDLPKKLTKTIIPRVLPRIEISQEGICLSTAVSEFEKNLIVQCLEQTKWVKKKAAKLLQVNRTTLVEKIKRHQLEQAAVSM